MLKLVWKLKGLFAFIVASGVVILGFTIVLNKSKKSDAAVEAPTVAAENVIVETEPNDSRKKRHKTNRSLGLADWMQVDGVFDSVDDSDWYSFRVEPDANGYEVQTWKEHKGELAAHTGMLGMNAFPITIVSYDKSNKVLTNQLLAASGGGADFPEGTTSVVVIVSGKEQDASPNPYSGGSKYRLYLKGRYKEVDTATASAE